MSLDSIYSNNKFAGVAQLVELLTCNEEVARSIRAASFGKNKIIGQVPKWPKGTDCKSVALVLQRFESSPAHKIAQSAILLTAIRIAAPGAYEELRRCAIGIASVVQW
jgi:hypothetical protein